MNELYHHGVKGMKWGVRKDNTLASMNAQPRNNSLKKAAAADNKKRENKASKIQAK